MRSGFAQQSEGQTAQHVWFSEHLFETGPHYGNGELGFVMGLYLKHGAAAVLERVQKAFACVVFTDSYEETNIKNQTQS